MPKYTKSKEKTVPGYVNKYAGSDRTMPSFKKKFKESSKIVYSEPDSGVQATRHHSLESHNRYTKAVPRKPRSRPAWERKNLAFETSKQ